MKVHDRILNSELGDSYVRVDTKTKAVLDSFSDKDIAGMKEDGMRMWEKGHG